MVHYVKIPWLEVELRASIKTQNFKKIKKYFLGIFRGKFLLIKKFPNRKMIWHTHLLKFNSQHFLFYKFFWKIKFWNFLLYAEKTQNFKKKAFFKSEDVLCEKFVKTSAQKNQKIFTKKVSFENLILQVSFEGIFIITKIPELLI